MGTGKLRASAAALAVLLCASVWTEGWAQSPEAGVVQSAEPQAPSSGGLGNGSGGLGNGGQQQPSSAESESSAEPAASEPEQAESEELEEPAESEPDAAAAQQAATAAAGSTSELSEFKGGVPKAKMPAGSGNSGSLSYDVAIDVPTFHGLEPKLILNYNSSRKTKLGGTYQGWLGYAWAFQGFDVIERNSPGYGLPEFKDTTDIFVLNGMELVPCPQASPSCTTGGNDTTDIRYTTEIESYRRISFNKTTNEWKVTDRDGTISTFRSQASLAGVSPSAPTPAGDIGLRARWMLASVVDKHDNAVTYEYDCREMTATSLTNVCYPERISYTGGEIIFYTELRPDSILMANGHDIAVTDRRIKSIKITSGGQLSAAYSLTYNEAPFSNASRLRNVSRHGTNATVDANGTISGGSSKTIAQMTYQDMTYGSHDRKIVSPSIYLRAEYDQNFDGRDELHQYVTASDRLSYTARRYIIDSNNQISAPSVQFDFNLGYQGRFDPSRNYVDNFSNSYDPQYHPISDGPRIGITNPDLTQTIYDNCESLTGVMKIYCGRVDNFSKGLSDRWRGNFVLDTDGDGFDEFYHINVFKSLGNDPYEYASFNGTADFRGDGSGEVIFLNYRNFAAARLVNGSPSYRFGQFPVDCRRTVSVAAYCGFADFNGDTAEDLFYVDLNNDRFRVFLSDGNKFSSISVINQVFNNYKYFKTIDIDGDGIREFVVGYGTKPNDKYDVLYTSFSNSSTTKIFQFPTDQGLILGFPDLNGDGVLDYIYENRISGRPDSVALSNFGARFPNLLWEIVAEQGGTITAEYAPSTRFENDFLPQVMHAVTKLSVDDGRGQVAETKYDYAGGKYDPKARKFLGYKTITETKPLANGQTTATTVKTTYRQDLASYGLPDEVIVKNGAAEVRKVNETYEVNTENKPYWAKNTGTLTTLTENISVTTRVTRTFDEWGNQNTEWDEGRVDLTNAELWKADDRWTLRNYNPNRTAFITSLAAAERVWPVNSMSDNPLSQVYTYFDGATALNTPPKPGRSLAALYASQLRYRRPTGGERIFHV